MTFNYACHRHTEDKDIQYGHKHRVNSGDVTLKATIKPLTKTTDGLNYKKGEEERGVGERIEQKLTDRKRLDMMVRTEKRST